MNVRNDNLDPPKSQARLASVMDFRKPALLLGASVQFNVRSNLIWSSEFFLNILMLDFHFFQN